MTPPFLLVDSLSQSASTDIWETRKRYRRMISFAEGMDSSRVEWAIIKPGVWEGLFLKPLPEFLRIERNDFFLVAERTGTRQMRIMLNECIIGDAMWPRFDRSTVILTSDCWDKRLIMRLGTSFRNCFTKNRKNIYLEVDRQKLAFFHGLTPPGVEQSNGRFCSEINQEILAQYDDTSQYCFLAALFMLMGMYYYEWMEYQSG